MIRRYLLIFFALICLYLLYVLGNFIYLRSDKTEKSFLIKDKSAKEIEDERINKFIKQYDKHFKSLFKTYKTPGAAYVIVKDNKILKTSVFGYKSIKTKDSIDINTIFRLGSVSKGFAGVLTGILVQEKILNWDDKVIKWVPDFSLRDTSVSNIITIKHILSQSTGLPEHTYTSLIEIGKSFTEMMDEVKKIRLSYKPGKNHSYQNVIYSEIAEVIENATGEKYKDLLKTKIFIPLGMHNSSASYAEIINADNVALPHRYKWGKYIPEAISENYYSVLPAAGVNASISDMGKWLVAMMGNSEHVISDSILNQVFNPVIDTYKRKKISSYNWKNLKKASYAMGWRVYYTKNDTIIYHGGLVNNYRSEIAFSERYKIGICVLANAPSKLTLLSVPDFFEMWNKSIYKKK